MSPNAAISLFFIFLNFLRHLYNLFYLYPPPIPRISTFVCTYPSLCPQLTLPYVHACVVFCWKVVALPGAACQRKLTPSLRSYQLPIAPYIRVGLHAQFSFLHLNFIWLESLQPYAWSLNCCELICVNAPLCPENTVFFLVFHCLSFLQSFCFLFPNDPWALEGSDWIQMAYLTLSILL